MLKVLCLLWHIKLHHNRCHSSRQQQLLIYWKSVIIQECFIFVTIFNNDVPRVFKILLITKTASTAQLNMHLAQIFVLANQLRMEQSRNKDIANKKEFTVSRLLIGQFPTR